MPSTQSTSRPPQTIIKASAPEELLALVAHTLGFWPQDSLVLVSLRGPRRRSGLVLRVDLEGLLRAVDQVPEQLVDVVGPLAVPMASDGASAVVAFVVEAAGGIRPQHTALADALGVALRQRGVELAEAGLVDDGRLFNLTCTDECCPAQGRLLGSVSASMVGAEMVAHGSVVAGGREEVVAGLLRGVAPAAADVRAQVAQLVDAARGAGDLPGAAELAAWFALLDAVEEAVDAAGGHRSADDAAAALVGAAEAATWLVLLDDLLIRDAVLVSVLPGARAVLAAPQGDAGGALEEDLRSRLGEAMALISRTPDSGDPGVLDAAGALVRRLAQLAPDERRAQPLAVLAYWGWWRGSTVEATVLAEEAQRSDPRHSLAGLVVRMADSAVAPDWVRQRARGNRAARRGARRRQRSA